jgi:hypothetical protein
VVEGHLRVLLAVRAERVAHLARPAPDSGLPSAAGASTRGVVWAAAVVECGEGGGDLGGAREEGNGMEEAGLDPCVGARRRVLIGPLPWECGSR